jgi:predicted AAA+ superfamily ATPase
MLIDPAPPSVTDLLSRLAHLLEQAERLLAARQPADDAGDLASAQAFTWVRRDGVGRFRPIRHVDAIALCDLKGIEPQLTVLTRNTRQFLHGAPANHVLLWGERGTGKSSAIKGLLTAFAAEGLRLVEVSRHNLLDLPEILDRLWERPEKFILFCDDLSFESDDAEYKALKALLEGGVQARPRHVLIYATSNRRHLLPERLLDRQAIVSGEEVHPNDALAEQLSLADRFGIRLGFYHLAQATYLQIVAHLAQTRGIGLPPDLLHRDALRWAQRASGLSGRSARQFIDDLEGRLCEEEAARSAN